MLLAEARIAHRYWASKFGSPSTASVAAWCDAQGITLAVPVRGGPPLSAAWGSPLSDMQVQVSLQPSSVDKTAPCAVRFESGFFAVGGTQNGTSPVDALLARAIHTECFAHTVKMDDNVTIHTNRLLLDPSSPSIRNVIVSCACSSTERDCVATARWEKEVLHKNGGGYQLNAAALLGPNRQIELAPDNETRLRFEVLGDSHLYLWPWKCNLLFHLPGAATPQLNLLYNGCPVSETYGFRTHAVTIRKSSGSILSYSPYQGHLAFSFNAMGPTIARNTSTISQLQCQMIQVEKLSQLPKCVQDETQPTKQSLLKRLRRSKRRLLAEPDDLEEAEEDADDQGGAEITMQSYIPRQPLMAPPTLESKHKGGPWVASGKGTLTTEKWTIEAGRSNNDFRGEHFKVSKKDAYEFFAGAANNYNAFHGGLGIGKNFSIHGKTDIGREEFHGGVKVRGYGLNLLRNNQERAQGVEMITPNVTVGTLVNFDDRNYGAKIRIKDFETAIRHDFDEHINQDDSKLATEFGIGFKDTGIQVGSDLVDSRYGLSIAVSKYKFAALRDFDDRQTDFIGNWGDGWQLYLSTNMPSDQDVSSAVKVGFGNTQHLYAVAGMGIDDTGVPEVSGRIQGKRGGFLVDIGGGVPDSRTFALGFAVGKKTFIWDSRVALDNLNLPVLFGLDPAALHHFLSPLSSVDTEDKDIV